jgi:uncharacterized membrane protein
MKRNRIVINLENLKGRPGRSGRGLGKPLLIIGIVLLLVLGGLAAGGYFWWRNYQNGPGYTLALLVDAVQHNDSATVDKILDADKISDDFVGQVRQKLPNADSPLLQTQADSVRSSISARLKETLREQLMKELQQLTDIAANKPFFIIALAVPRFVDFKEENNTAKGTANIKDQQIQLTMQSDGKSWRITAVKDEKLAKMVADSLMSSVPTNASQLQDAIKRQLEKMNK